VAPHRRALERLGHEVVLLRTPSALGRLDGLVLPGGESTAQRQLLETSGLWTPVAELVRSGIPVLGTCAGLVLLAQKLEGSSQKTLGGLNITLRRNGWGRQLDSFEAQSDGDGLPLVFIRAPRIRDAGPGVDILATYRREPVLVRQGNVVGTTFHPELTDDVSIHEDVFGWAGG
jgi:5'-phosphate synthase pdxT subunit